MAVKLAIQGAVTDEHPSSTSAPVVVVAVGPVVTDVVAVSAAPLH